jgi:hypothetical protein
MIMSLYDLKPSDELISAILEEVKIDLSVNHPHI